MKDSNWDLDYRDGILGEKKIADLLSMDTIEVKTDRRWKYTGNLYIETECYYQKTDTWEKSGISVSKATHWAFVLEDSVLIVPTYRLREAIHDNPRPITCNIPPNPSRGTLITAGTLIEHIRAAKEKEIAAHDSYESWSDPAEWENPI